MAEPAITRQASQFSPGANLPITRVVIHATCPDVGFPRASKKGTASGTAKFFAKPETRFQAHYVEGVDREEHCVREAVKARHAPPNSGSIGVEITADGGDVGAFKDPDHPYTRDQWLSVEVVPALGRAADRPGQVAGRRRQHVGELARRTALTGSCRPRLRAPAVLVRSRCSPSRA
jgi:hypothetical protein